MKHKIKHASTLVAMIFVCTLINAQELFLKGRIINKDSFPIEGAIVSHVRENIAYSTSLTDSAGLFSIKVEDLKNSILVVMAFGYKTDTLHVNLADTKGRVKEIVMKDLSDELAEVVVTAKPYNIKQDADGLHFKLVNPDLKNNSTFEVLKLVPFVRVDEIKGLSMMGKSNLVVYINGRKNRVTSPTFLQNISAEQIKDIKVITNPGSKYDVPMNTGIIDITLASFAGLKGTVAGIITQTKVNKQILTLNTSYNLNKFYLNSYIHLRNLADYRRAKEDILFNDTKNFSRSTGRNDGHRQEYMVNLDAKYQLNTKHIVGAAFDFYAFPGQPQQNTITSYGNLKTNRVDSLMYNYIDRDNIDCNVSGNVNYTWNINEKGNKLQFDIDYLHGLYRNKAQYKHFVEKEGEKRLMKSYSQNNPQTSNVWMLKAEHYYPINNKHKMAWGVNAYFSQIGYVDEYDQNIHSLDNMKNDFDYHEKRVGAFTSYNGTITGNFKVNAGMRLEWAGLDGMQGATREEFSENHLNVLPSVSLSYQFKNLSISYNMSTRSSFPSFTLLNPFKIYESATSYSVGNPTLNPSKNLHQQISLLWNNWYANIYHAHLWDAQAVFSHVVDAKNNIIETSPVNYGSSNEYGLTMGVSFSPIRNIWYMNTSLDAVYLRYKKDVDWVELTNKKGWMAFFNLSNSFILSSKHRWNCGLDFFFSSKQQRMNYDRGAFFELSANMKKSFQHFDISIYAYNTWIRSNGKYSGYTSLVTITPSLYKIRDGMTEPYGVRFTVAYNFGNKKLKTMRGNDNTKDYKNRIKRD